MGHSAGFPVTVSLVARRHPAFCFVDISANGYLEYLLGKF